MARGRSISTISSTTSRATARTSICVRLPMAAPRSVRSTSHRSSSRPMLTATAVNVLLPGDFTVAVRDDVPASVGAPISATVLEDGLSLAQGDHTEGNRENGESLSSDEASGAPGSLIAGVLPGADEPLTFSLTSPGMLPTLFSHGEQVNYQIVGNTLTASTLSFGQVFTLTVNIDGSWSFDLTGQLDHVEW